MSEKGYKTDMSALIVQETLKDRKLVKFGRWDWRVLDEQDGKMLILTDCVVDYTRYHEPDTKITWEDCNLRKYLNEQFVSEFSDSEKARIIKAKVENKGNPWYKLGKGGNDTEDCIFLLSIDELVKYFGDSGDLAKRKGWYWAGAERDKEDREYDINEMILKNKRGQFLYDQYNDARIAKNLYNDTSWWRLPAFARTRKHLLSRCQPYRSSDYNGYAPLRERYAPRNVGQNLVEFRQTQIRFIRIIRARFRLRSHECAYLM